MGLEDAGCRARFLIRDRDAKFPEMFDAVLADAGTAVVLSGVRVPRMNSIIKGWVQTCRRELLDRTLIWNLRHLLHALREFGQFYNSHRPHQGFANARPLSPLPAPIADPDKMARLDIRRRNRLGGNFTNTNMPPDQHGQGFRQGQRRAYALSSADRPPRAGRSTRARRRVWAAVGHRGLCKPPLPAEGAVPDQSGRHSRESDPTFKSQPLRKLIRTGSLLAPRQCRATQGFCVAGRYTPLIRPAPPRLPTPVVPQRRRCRPWPVGSVPPGRGG
ncbi:integrase core domain-containing protein [Micromonospora arborensis]|uniref:integrase core domain-containing protein n=1 Tax=Micromonospora arborensis TaxID=2116518 RepID=UPI00341197C6